MSRLIKLKEFLGFGPAPEPVTFKTVQPAPRPAAKEAEIKKEHAKFAGELVGMERKAYEIRRELAGRALSIVSGD